MSDDLGRQIAELTDGWKHACDVAMASIGQVDRADNLRYRDRSGKTECPRRADIRPDETPRYRRKET